MAVLLFLQVFLVFGAGAKLGAAQADCSPSRCSNFGPEIRFPFWLKGHQSERCGYPRPEFQLSCSPIDNTTELDLQYPIKASTLNNTLSVFTLRVKFSVDTIDYRYQEIRASYITGDCLPKQLPHASNVSSSEAFALKLDKQSGYGYTLFNCSLNNNAISAAIARGTVMNCLTGGGYLIVALASSYSLSSFTLASCTKMYNISYVPSSILDAPELLGVGYFDETLMWSEPSCSGCESKGKYCKLTPNATNAQTQCVDIPRQHSKQGPSKKYVIKAVVVPPCWFCWCRPFFCATSLVGK